MEEIILKWKKTPGPMTYKTNSWKKNLNSNISKEPKNGYSMEIEAWAKEIPSVGKYNLLKSFSSVEKHIFACWFGPSQRNASASSGWMAKITKIKAPGPADYDVESSFWKT